MQRSGQGQRRVPNRFAVLRPPVLAAGALVLAAAAVLASQAGSFLVVSRPLARPDAILSLASHEWERLPFAARLAAEHARAAVVLTVPSDVTPFNCHDCANRVARLGRRGVAAERIRLVDLRLPGTHGEARAALAFARASGIRRLLIVTSPYHTRRALATFQHVFDGSGIEIGIAPAEGTSPARPSRWFLAPYDRAYVAYEWAAIVYYGWTHGVNAVS